MRWTRRWTFNGLDYRITSPYVQGFNHAIVGDVMAKVRSPAVAGLFYPASAAELSDEVSTLLAEIAIPKRRLPVPKAIIAPHAGYVCSGPNAASVYARLAPVRGMVKRVILAGPVHRVPVRGLALPDADMLAT